MEKKDGLRYRRDYAFFGNLVRFSGEERVDAPRSNVVTAEAKQSAAAEPAPAAQESLFRRAKHHLMELTKRYLGI